MIVGVSTFAGDIFSIIEEAFSGDRDMLRLFEPLQFGHMHVENRFVHSATHDEMATEDGTPTDAMVTRYRRLAQGEIGLIITGMLYVHVLGRGFRHQAGIHEDAMIAGLRRIVEAVHREGGKIMFQLGHAGRQTHATLLGGQTPLAPSRTGRDPVNLVTPHAMTEAQIREVIQAFAHAARRAVEAGADGIQLHAAHGYLINQFLSPFFNRRMDSWGGSDNNRFRVLQEILQAIKQTVPRGMPVFVKLNTHDYTPKEGMTPALAAIYAGWLAELHVDGIEVSCGTTSYSAMQIFRGAVPVRELVHAVPWWQKPVALWILTRMAGRFELREGYNLDAARLIKPRIGQVPLIVVGGFRRVPHMEAIVEQGSADALALCRPFIREPHFVKRVRAGNTETASCVSCNRCAAAVANAIPVRCYHATFLA